MFYIAKLARRLARLRLGVPSVHSSGMVSLLLLAACSAGEPTALDTGSPLADDRPVIVSPRMVTLEASQAVRFAAFESLIPGSSEVTAIEWTATGGSIGSDGTYNAGGLGDFKVIGKKKGWANKPGLEDTAVVIVVPPQPTVTALQLTPTGSTVHTYGQIQFSANGILSDSSEVPVGVTWTATGGRIDAGGLYTASNVAGTYSVTATHTGTGITARASVAVTATLQSIRLDPSSTSLAAGGSKQFSVSGTMTDGSSASLSGVVFSATGGSISSTGYYTAPLTGGTYSVSARATSVDGVVLTASATVSVTAPTTSSSTTTPTEGYENQPSGFSRVASTFFKCIPSSSGCDQQYGAWGNNLISNLSILGDVTNPITPGASVLRIRFPSGFRDGSAPAHFWGWSSPRVYYKKIYISQWIKIGDRDFQNQSVGTKLWYIGYGKTDRSNQFFPIVRGTGSQTVMTNFNLSFDATMEYSLAGSSNSIQDYFANQGTGSILPTGRWHHLEFVMELNTDGVENGILKVWIDGRLYASHNRVTYINSAKGATLGFFTLNYDPVYGGSSGDIRTRDDYMYTAGFYVSGVPQ